MCVDLLSSAIMRSFHKFEDSTADIQNWIEPFQHLTFPTVIIPFSKELGVIYLKDYRHRYCSSNTPLSSQETFQFQQLTEQINSTIQQFQSPCFIRLTTRSPKDAAMIPCNDLKSLQNSPQLPINQKLIRYFELLTQYLQVTNGSQAMRLLQESERVFLDIQQAFDASTPTSPVNPQSHLGSYETTASRICPWDMGICIRKWDHRINEKYEFRCFVFQNNLVAISQYNTYIYCEELLRDRDILQSLMIRFYQFHILPIFQHSNNIPTSCILDLAIFLPLPTLSELSSGNSLSFFLDHLIVIELNPYNRRTGGGCFHWDLDSGILFPDRIPVESSVVFRLVGEQTSGGFDLSEFTKRQENVFEGLLSEYERDQYLTDQKLEQSGKGSEEEEKTEISRCHVM
jgi:hypothetical protein